MGSILHIVPGIDDVANGMAVVARLLAKEQGNAEVVDLNHGMRRIHDEDVEEVWVHGMWLPKEWAVCRAALRAGKRLVRMTHGSLSPVYLTHQSCLRKKLVAPIERHFLLRACKLVATCEAEKGWIEAYLGRRCPHIEVTDLKRFFDLGRVERVETCRDGENKERDETLHLLYLGRRHPLKGVEYLETAVRQIEDSSRSTCSTRLKIISSAFGEELEKVWGWCDVLVLPTLSENFGLVIAEALERGKRVITTDGAPAWGDGNDYGGRLVYVKGYRDGTDEERVNLLKDAIRQLTTNNL